MEKRRAADKINENESTSFRGVTSYLPASASPLCSTSSILATMILCTSCSSVLMLPRFLLARLSMYDFFVFWMYVSGKGVTQYKKKN